MTRIQGHALLPVAETVRRTAADRGLLTARVAEFADADLTAPYRRPDGTAMGDFCDSLHDLVGHVLMWDEINLAVLSEARRGRPHWSLHDRWEDPRIGTMLNVAGVAAARELPPDLLVHRFTVVRDALLDEFTRYDEESWRSPLDLEHTTATSIGGLSEYVMTVPGAAPYWHAALHLGELAAVRE